MPTSIELPHASVAIINRGTVDLVMVYAQKSYEYLKPSKEGPKVKVVPLEIAHKHFGFEIRQGRLYRNTQGKYEEGDETAYYVARATYLPWGWERQSKRDNPDHVFNPDAPEKDQITKAQAFRMIRDTWENKIEGRLIAAPAEMRVEEFESLPA